MELDRRRQNGRETEPPENTDKKNQFNHPKEGSTKSALYTSKPTMVLEHSTSKKAIKYSSVLDVLITEEEVIYHPNLQSIDII